MNNNPTRIPSQVIFGAIVIGLGLLFLLDNFEIIDFHFSLHLWPMIFIIAGALKVAQARSAPGYFVGGGLIALGAAMTSQRLGLLHFSWHMWWPVVLIFAGGALVFKAFYGRTHVGDPLMGIEGDNERDSYINAMAVLGGFRRSIRSPDFRGGEITAVMGGCELDLREATLNGDAVLNVFAMWGGINIKVPADWTVIIEGTPIMGGFDEKTVSPAGSRKRLIIRGYAIMGGCEVRN